MRIKIERESVGYKYTDETDEDRSGWDVTTDYINHNIYLNPPSDDENIDEIAAYGKAIVKACRDMKREIKDNRVPVK